MQHLPLCGEPQSKIKMSQSLVMNMEMLLGMHTVLWSLANKIDAPVMGALVADVVFLDGSVLRASWLSPRKSDIKYLNIVAVRVPGVRRFQTIYARRDLPVKIGTCCSASQHP